MVHSEDCYMTIHATVGYKAWSTAAETDGSSSHR
jgi:hypothetical protein